MLEKLETLTIIRFAVHVVDYAGGLYYEGRKKEKEKIEEHVTIDSSNDKLKECRWRWEDNRTVERSDT